MKTTAYHDRARNTLQIITEFFDTEVYQQRVANAILDQAVSATTQELARRMVRTMRTNFPAPNRIRPFGTQR